jgi:hypothetical protein
VQFPELTHHCALTLLGTYVLVTEAKSKSSGKNNIKIQEIIIIIKGHCGAPKTVQYTVDIIGTHFRV